MSDFCKAMVVTMVAILAPISLNGQDARGTILGRVTDPSEAVVSGAEVGATNITTGVLVVTKTNESGNYILPYLLPGTYTVHAKLAGFKRFVHENVEVRVNDTVGVDIAMQLGDAVDSIDVKAETPLLSTASVALGQVVDERRITELPTFGGGAFALVALSAGYANQTYLRPLTTGGPQAAAQFSADGVGAYKHEFTLDGVTDTHDQSMGAGFIPPQLAVSEFKVQTSSYDASIGHTMGAVVNASIKGGTNQYHGAAHWFVMNKAFDAATIFQNRSGQKVSVYQNNRFAAAIGGPLQIPKVYNGKNKTFWFYTWEWNPNTSPDNFIRSVPTEAERRGDFSQLLALGSNYQIYDPMTTRALADGRFQRDPIPGNVLPSSRLDPVALNIMKYWPAPNATGTADFRNNWNNFQPGKYPDLMHVARVDHAFSPNHRVFVRVHRDSWSSKSNQLYSDEISGVQNQREKRGAALDDVFVFTPTFFLNFRYGLTQQDHTSYRLSRGFDMSTLGFSSALVNLSSDKADATFPRVSVSPFGYLSDGLDYRRSWLVHDFNGNLTKMRGNHTIRFGADFRLYRDNYFDYTYDISPQLTYSSTYTRGPYNTSAAPTVGGEIASFLLGIPAGLMTRSGSYAEQDEYVALYIQDDFKVTSRLTLNLGLRYEYEWPITERFNRSVIDFAFGQSNPIEAQAKANYSLNPIPEVPVNQFRVQGGPIFAGVNGQPRALFQNDKNDFLPRIGLVWQLQAKTVLRAGYGIFYDSLGVNVNDAIQTGFSMSTPIQASIDSGLTYIATNANPLPNGLLDPVGASLGLKTNLAQSISFYQQKRKHPYAQRWSFDLQRLLPGQFLLEAGYVGNRGTHLQVSRELNALPLQYLSTSPVRDQNTINYLSQSFPNPFYGTNEISGKNISRSGLLVAYPEFSSVTVAEPTGYSWYHSLQVRAEKRLAHGYTFQAAYTWSKTMEATTFLNAGDAVPYEHISAEDRTHRLVLSWIWELPWGRGRSYGGQWSRPVDFLLGGWQLNGVMQRQSGPAMAWGDIWTLFTGDPDKVKLSKNERNVDRWFNIDAGFNRNTAQQLGSHLRTTSEYFSDLRSDGQARWDLGLIKSFRVTESLKAQFRAEALNAWNHPNLLAPSVTPTSTTFGMVTSQAQPRRFQFALKLMF